MQAVADVHLPASESGSMSAKKTRPSQGDPVTPEMSLRDMAAALGTSTAELCEWRRLAEIPEEEFERRLASAKGDPRAMTTTALIRGAPVRARGRVERALALYNSMPLEQRQQFEMLKVRAA